MLSLVLANACGPRTGGVESTPSFLVEAGEPVAFEAVSVTGPAPATGWVRAIDNYATSVPSESVTLTVGGTAFELSFDGVGYAEVVNATAGQSVGIQGAGAPAEVHALSPTWVGLGLDPATPPFSDTATFTVPVDNAVLLASGAEVWWVPVGQAAAHLVLRADGPILGLRDRAVDVDGVHDAVAWTENSVFLLRGRLAGGFARGAVLQADGFTTGGADVGDFDGDNLPDLAMGWSDGTTHVLDLWKGDGEWSFEALAPRELVVAPQDVLIGDNTVEGLAQVTVLLRDSDWVRYIEGKPGLFMQVGPSKPAALKLASTGSLLSRGDMTGDDAVEIYALDPFSPGSERKANILQVDREVLVLVEEGHVGAQVALADGNVDGLEDLFLLDENGLLSGVWFGPSASGAEGSFHPIQVESFPEAGPIAVSVWLGPDASPDLFVAGSTGGWWHRGAELPSEDIAWWHSGVAPTRAAATALPGPMAVVELDGNPLTVDVITFEADADGTRLHVTAFLPGAIGDGLGSALVSEAGDPVDDFDLCNGVAWVVASGALTVVDLTGGTPAILATNGTAAHRIACGALGGSAVAALLVDDEFVTITASAAAVGDRLPANGAQDLAIADIGDGPRIHSCATAGCRITDWQAPFGSAVVIGSPGQTTITTAAGVFSLAVGGNPNIVDGDGDGDEDLLLVEGGVPALGSTSVSVVFGTAQSWGAPQRYSVPLDLGTWAGLADADGDQSADLWALTSSGGLIHTLSPTPPEPVGTTSTTATTATSTPTL